MCVFLICSLLISTSNIGYVATGVGALILFSMSISSVLIRLLIPAPRLLISTSKIEQIFDDGVLSIGWNKVQAIRHSNSYIGLNLLEEGLLGSAQSIKGKQFNALKVAVLVECLFMPSHWLQIRKVIAAKNLEELMQWTGKNLKSDLLIYWYEIDRSIAEFTELIASHAPNAVTPEWRRKSSNFQWLVGSLTGVLGVSIVRIWGLPDLFKGLASRGELWQAVGATLMAAAIGLSILSGVALAVKQPWKGKTTSQEHDRLTE
ncbi:glr2654 [Gloeobacter violaceus PCC 7421]|uniref:Glr2654 protein n=1 Tax=Gloeobacter violaceus (strain ATCC 29082 / PCC 7421) TaxID=251221 RepID=Q7NH83_GLOVI|nr:glr2654 [Gloeobacter violaceus PCC 7421]